MFQQIYLGFLVGLRYESTPFLLRQYEGSTTPFRRSKYIPAQTTFRQQKDNLKDIYMVIPWGPPVQRLTSFFNKINFSIIRQKKDRLQTLQTILHRIGPFVSILARSSARTHTPLQKEIQFEQN